MGGFWGQVSLRSINAESFNTHGTPNAYLPRNLRDFANTLLRINNLVLNVLGYIPGIAQISGCIRMGIGCCIVAFTLALGSPKENEGLIIGRWFSEALLTGTAQIARGALEAFIPFGRQINMSLDGIGTILNLRTECLHAPSYGEYVDRMMEIDAEIPGPPYRDPNYPFPLELLKLA